MRRGRVAALAVVVGGVVFGALGGEYSTLDWGTLRRQVAAERAAVAALEAATDSLATWARALETDPRTQERVARERFGMVRPGEILYRVEPVEEIRR